MSALPATRLGQDGPCEQQAPGAWTGVTILLDHQSTATSIIPGQVDSHVLAGCLGRILPV